MVRDQHRPGDPMNVRYCATYDPATGRCTCTGAGLLAAECGGEWLPINASLQECADCGAIRPIPDDCIGDHPNCIGDHRYHLGPAAPRDDREPCPVCGHGEDDHDARAADGCDGCTGCYPPAGRYSDETGAERWADDEARE
jgi:hypothetical protein